MSETIDGSGEPAAGSSYAYKASLIGSAHRFVLTEDRLVWHVGGRSGLWPYTDIAAVRLSYRPVSMQSRRFRADIDHVSGARVRVLSTTWQTVTLMKPQDNDYRAFITQLHRRLKEAGSRAELVGGLRPGLYIAGVVLLALVTIAIAGLLARALATGEWAGALFLVGFAALFGWQIGGFVRRNRPRRYGFDALPGELLP
ncbi:MAG: hypothetical protein QOJ84_4453 [Bradyrhizobium sp.]|nr:hypothetical protein [Bradyrhizobium sp.]